MTYSLIISDTAQKQIDGAVLYLINELHSPFAAGSLIDDIERAYDRIQFMPYAMPKCTDPILRENDYHKTLLDSHDYILIFRVDADIIKIYGFFHMLQNYAEKV